LPRRWWSSQGYIAGGNAPKGQASNHRDKGETRDNQTGLEKHSLVSLKLPDAQLVAHFLNTPRVMSYQTEPVVRRAKMIILGIYQGDLVLPEQFVEIHCLVSR
jgi:hypothetical protein